jgi:AraC-like DNA-binding protein
MAIRLQQQAVNTGTTWHRRDAARAAGNGKPVPSALPVADDVVLARVDLPAVERGRGVRDQPAPVFSDAAPRCGPGLAARWAADRAETAHKAGFADQAHFTRTFKAAFGLTPGRYVRLCAGASIKRRRAVDARQVFLLSAVVQRPARLSAMSARP